MSNTMSKRGAEKLAARIRMYWMSRGKDVDVRAVPSGSDEDGKALYFVRSDMIGGQPRS